VTTWLRQRPAVLSVVTLVLIGTVGAFRQSGILTGDKALIELRTRDVLSLHPPLLGPYSRFGWAHPGPVLYFFLALPHTLLGGTSTALMIGVVLWNTLAVGTAIWLAVRQGALACCGVCFAVIVTIWTSTPALLIDPWNPSMVILPFLLGLVACACLIAGDERALTPAVLTLIVILQTHVGSGVVLAPATALALVVWWRREDRTMPSRFVWICSLALLAPIAIETLTNWPGNAARLLKFNVTSSEPRAGLLAGVRMLAHVSSVSFAFRPKFDEFFGFVVERQSFGLLPGVLVVSLVAVTRSRNAAARSGALVCLVAIGSAALAVANIRGGVYPYLLTFVGPIVYLSWAVVLGAILDLVRERLHTIIRPAAVVASVAAVATLLVATCREDRNHDVNERSIRQLSVAVERIAGADPILLSMGSGDQYVLIDVIGGMYDELDLANVDFRVLPAAELVVGSHRVERAANGIASVTLMEEPVSGSGASPDTVLADLADPLSPIERAECDELTAALTQELHRAGLDAWAFLLSDTRVLAIPFGDAVITDDTREDLNRLSELRAAGPRLALYLTSPGESAERSEP
jgi:hypothetical protein